MTRSQTFLFNKEKKYGGPKGHKTARQKKTTVIENAEQQSRKLQYKERPEGGSKVPQDGADGGT